MSNVLLIVYDNESHISFFPQGIAYLAASLREGGHKVKIWQQDLYHYPETHLTALLDREHFDIVGLGFVAGYYQVVRARKISQAVNRSKNRHRFLYVLGGHGPAAEPEYFLDKCEADWVVVGDGEELLVSIASAGKPPQPMWGSHSPKENPDEIPWPAYDLFPIEIYRLHRFPGSQNTDFTMPVLSGRGCKWKCTFCYRMDPGFRPRQPEAVIEEMRYLNRTWGINHFQFSDELFMSSQNRITTFCEKLINEGVNKWAKWDCNGRLNYATPEVLKLMKMAGCNYINYGCESLSQEALNKMKKGLTVDQIYRGVEATKAVGIHMGLNYIWPMPGDTLESLNEAVKFLLKYDGIAELRTIRPPSPYPGSQLYQQAIKEGKLTGPEHFYEKKHLNSDLLTLNYTEDLTDDEVHYALAKANTELILGYHSRCGIESSKIAIRFYSGWMPPNEFRGWRAV